MSSGIRLAFRHHADFCLSQKLALAVHPLSSISLFRTTPLPHGQTMQSLQHRVVMHIWDGLISLYSMERDREREVSFLKIKTFCERVRWLHVETGVTITIFDIFSEIIVLSLNVWKVKWFINLPVCEPAYSGSSFVSLSNTSSWYNKKLRKVTVSKFKMTAEDIMMLPDTPYSCSA